MTTKALQRPTLVLNRNWQPVNVATVARALVLLWNETGVEPTNNGMEQRMRFVAVDRKITQGTRGERGRRWCERIWTVLATSVQQGRSAFQLLHQSILAYFCGHAAPSLLAIPP